MTTTNKGLDQPAHNAPNWDTPLNTNFGYIDDAFGGVTSISVTSVGTSPVALTLTQYQKLVISFSGTLSNNVNYQVPAGVGGQWIIYRNTTGSHDINITSGGAGLSQLVFAGANPLFSDGTNIITLNSVKPGTIMEWSGSAASIPGGWGICNGTTYNRTDGSGTIASPDLRNKFVIGAGSTYNPGDTGGSTTIAQANLTGGIIPGATLTLSTNDALLIASEGGGGSAGWLVGTGSPNATRETFIVNTNETQISLNAVQTPYLQPYYALCKIMKI